MADDPNAADLELVRRIKQGEDEAFREMVDRYHSRVYSLSYGVLRNAEELKVDPDSLYMEEIFTDRRIGTIRRLTPVKDDGQKDTARAVLYMGETQVLTPAGALPIGFEIGAGSLGEAAEKFGQLAKEAIERTVRELQELRRQQASSIVIPQGGLPPGGMGPGGKIQMP